jgi:hypothetical protein
LASKGENQTDKLSLKLERTGILTLRVFHTCTVVAVGMAQLFSYSRKCILSFTIFAFLNQYGPICEP